MSPVQVDAVKQLRYCLAPILGNPSQAFPKRIFKADAGLVSSNDNRALGDCGFHDCHPPVAKGSQ
jgi:hypothetical protein